MGSFLRASGSITRVSYGDIEAKVLSWTGLCKTVTSAGINVRDATLHKFVILIKANETKDAKYNEE